MPAEAQELLTQFLRAPLSDEDEREFLTRWTTWWDICMAVADWSGEEDMDQLWNDLRELSGSTLLL